MLTLLLVTAITTAELAALRRFAGGFVPAMIPVGVINALLTAGWLFWEDVAPFALVSAKLTVLESELHDALLTGLLFTGALTIGAIVLRPVATSVRSMAHLPLPAASLVWVGLGVLAVRLIGVQGNVLRSPEYLGFSGPRVAVSLGGALAPLAILALCYAVFQPGRHRAAAALGLIAWVLVLFAASSRQLALVPGLLLLGRLLSRGTRHPGRLALAGIALVPLTIALASLAITLRANPGGTGLLTLGYLVWSEPGVLIGQSDPRQVIGNVLFSSPLIARVSDLRIDPGVFWTSVSPLPGAFTDWPVIQPAQRINVYTPYAGLGELAAHGAIAVSSYGFVVGLALSLISRQTARLPGAWRAVGMVIAVALASLYSVTMLQYNLRNGTRQLWYALAAILIVRAFARAFSQQRQQPDERRVDGLTLGERLTGPRQPSNPSQSNF